MKLDSVQSSPHLPVPSSVTRIMLWVVLALIPGTLVSVWFFGTGVLINMAFAVVAALIGEAVMLSLRKRPIVPFISDGSAVVTALLLALALVAGGSDMDISEVKVRHEQELLAMPGVVSVGIGLAADGEQAIIIGITEDDVALKAKLPATLEGHPVVVRITGKIKAQ